MKHTVENGSCLFRGLSSVEFFLTCHREAQFRGTVDGFIVVGHDLEFIGQRNFIVSVQVVDYGKLDTEFLKGIGIKPHLLQVGYPQQLAGRMTGIDQRAQ